MKRRCHQIGETPEGENVYIDCATKEICTVSPLEAGKPIHPGTTVATIREREDCVEIEDVDLHSGPVQVATAAYREGWARTFGSN